jgi:hypothetical protein
MGYEMNTFADCYRKSGGNAVTFSVVITQLGSTMKSVKNCWGIARLK